MNNSTPEYVECPLCKHDSQVFYQFKARLYHQCKNCRGIFVDPSLLPNGDDEKTRYEEHNNDINDQGYQKFVSPITKSVLRDYTSEAKGLDFGAGTGPVIANLLREAEFDIKLYDPFFYNYPSLLKQKYDYIVCCEVIEHFHFPDKEFLLFKELLKENGTLYCMTDVYDKSIDFHKWYYKNDQTHVFIYQKETLEWIKNNFDFSKLSVDNRLVIWRA